MWEAPCASLPCPPVASFQKALWCFRYNSGPGIRRTRTTHLAELQAGRKSQLRADVPEGVPTPDCLLRTYYHLGKIPTVPCACQPQFVGWTSYRKWPQAVFPTVGKILWWCKGASSLRNFSFTFPRLSTHLFSLIFSKLDWAQGWGEFE